jgi:hypothetical protein
MDRFEKLRDESIFWNSISEHVKEREPPTNALSVVPPISSHSLSRLSQNSSSATLCNSSATLAKMAASCCQLCSFSEEETSTIDFSSRQLRDFL